jgi:hypothetical protein
MANYRFLRVNEEKLQRIFNENEYWERAQGGEFSEEVIDDAPAARKYRFPAGTRDQTVWYHETTGHGRRVAVVHQFRKRDGTLAASGRPDPKWVLVGNTIYAGPDRWGIAENDPA